MNNPNLGIVWRFAKQVHSEDKVVPYIVASELAEEVMKQAAANGAGASRECMLRAAIAELQRENAALRESATRLIQNNGGPLQSDEAVECDRQDDYIMVKVQDFEVLCAAIDAARKEQSK